MNTKPKKYFRADNKLTSYALSCGYAYNKGGYTLTKIHGVYKVASLYDMQFFETLNEAYKYLNK